MAKRAKAVGKRTFVRSTNWIGDAVISVAAIRELRRLLPEDHITLFARQWVADLFEGQGLVNEIIRFQNDEWTFKYRNKFHGYQTAVLFQNAFQAALLAFLSRIPKRVGYAAQYRSFLLTHAATRRTKRLRKHQVYDYLDLLYQGGLSTTNYLEAKSFLPDISLRPTPAAAGRARQLLETAQLRLDRPMIGLNPGAFYGPAKRWLVDRYASLADRIITGLGASVVIFGSEQERPLAEEISSLMKQEPLILTGRTELSTLMGLISLCQVFVTNDSGPMHLAAALGIPLVALFGSTDEIATGPFSSEAIVIHKHVECSPCLRRECPIDLRCFKRITVEEVFQSVAEKLP